MTVVIPAIRVMAGGRGISSDSGWIWVTQIGDGALYLLPTILNEKDLPNTGDLLPVT